MHRSRALEASLLLGTAGGMMWGPPEAWARHHFPSKDQVSMKGLSFLASQGSCRPPALESLSHQLRRDSQDLAHIPPLSTPRLPPRFQKG